MNVSGKPFKGASFRFRRYKAFAHSSGVCFDFRFYFWTRLNPVWLIFGKAGNVVWLPLFISRIFHRHKSRDRRQANGVLFSLLLFSRRFRCYGCVASRQFCGSAGTRRKGVADHNRRFNPVPSPPRTTGKLIRVSGD